MAAQLPDFEGDAGSHLEATPVMQFCIPVPPDSSADGLDVAISTTSAPTTAAVGSTTAIIFSDVLCFVVRGASPTATAAKGIPVPANTLLRVFGLALTDKLAFITPTGTGTARVRPGL